MSVHRVVLFDLDGTISDSAPGIIRGIRHALGVVGVHPPEGQDWSRYLGPPLRDMLVDFHGLTDDQVTVAVDAYLEYYNGGGMFENELYPGIPELIAELSRSGTSLAVATSKRAFMAQGILDHFGLLEHFAVVEGAHPDGTGGRKHEVIARVLDRLGTRDRDQGHGSGAVMIGDREHDIHGASVLGLPTIGVSWGYAVDGELEAAGADLIVDTVSELRAALGLAR